LFIPSQLFADGRGILLLDFVLERLNLGWWQVESDFAAELDRFEEFVLGLR